MKVVSLRLLYNDRILLLQRGLDDKRPFTWTLPGGKIEGDETVYQAINREVFEEIKFDCSSATYIKSFILGRNIYTIYTLSIDTLYIPILNEEHTGFGWFQHHKALSLIWDEQFLC